MYSSCPASISFVTICETNHSFCCFSNKLLLFLLFLIITLTIIVTIPACWLAHTKSAIRVQTIKMTSDVTYALSQRKIILIPLVLFPRYCKEQIKSTAIFYGLYSYTQQNDAIKFPNSAAKPLAFHFNLNILWRHFMVCECIDHRKLPSIC